MAQTAKEFLTAIHRYLIKGEATECDSQDCEEDIKVGVGAEGEQNIASFTAFHNVGYKVPGKRGPGAYIPQGHFEYDIVVTRKWVPFDDE